MREERRIEGSGKLLFSRFYVDYDLTVFCNQVTLLRMGGSPEMIESSDGERSDSGQAQCCSASVPHGVSWMLLLTGALLLGLIGTWLVWVLFRDPTSAQ